MDAGTWVGIGGVLVTLVSAMAALWRQGLRERTNLAIRVTAAEGKIEGLQERRESADSWRVRTDERLDALAQVPDALQRLERGVGRLDDGMNGLRGEVHDVATDVARIMAAREVSAQHRRATLPPG